ncbi:MAG: DUF485 domain-containing protein [Microlunatus sp.]|nr:DUF485 domain-containing protein [Microlunatus sp.]MDN5770403.1 DUF485 domain-containing protein [Microlunatus sp.]MDN5804087.1 DUF485 domain-containing protein [Microlunatus sp.]
MAPAGNPPTHDNDATSNRFKNYYSGMVTARHRLVRPLVIITLVAFFLQQILTNFTSVLDGGPFYGMTWAYIYAFALFFLVVILTTFYRSRMDRAEATLRPAELDPTSTHYDDSNQWDQHERLLETEEEQRDLLDRQAHGDEQSGGRA